MNMSWLSKTLVFPAIMSSLIFSGGALCYAHPDTHPGAPPVDDHTCDNMQMMFSGMSSSGTVPPDMIAAVKSRYQQACTAKRHGHHHD